jgi:hypothetical protein
MRTDRHRLATITRRVAVALPAGTTDLLPQDAADGVVHCARGAVWITDDGDPRDVILGARQSCAVEREGMRLHALEDAVIEVEFPVRH